MTAERKKDDAVEPNQGSKPSVVTVVLTPGRSGSSLLMEVLGNLGAGLSDELIPGRLENPHGFFEDARVVEIHKKLMSDLGARPGFPMPEGWLDQQVTRKTKRALTDVVRKQVAPGANGWAVKDPRIAELLPLWLQVFNSAGVMPRFVLALRDPVAVATSLRRSINRDERLTELQWLYRTTQALYHTAADCFVVHYEDWSKRPGETACDLAQHVGLPKVSQLQGQQAVEKAIEQRLDRSSWNNYAVQHPLVKRLYAALRGCSGTNFDRMSVLETVRECDQLIDAFRAWEAARPAKSASEPALNKAYSQAQLQKPMANKSEAQPEKDEAPKSFSRGKETTPANENKKTAEEYERKMDTDKEMRGKIATKTETIPQNTLIEKLVRDNHRLLRELKETEMKLEDARKRTTRKEQHHQPKKQTAPPGVRALKKNQPGKRKADPEQKIRNSIRFRLGDTLVSAVKKPGKNTLLAPTRVMRLLAEGLRSRKNKKQKKSA